MKSETLYQIVRAAIVSGKYPIGNELPSEVDLCKEHKMARGTVRIALSRLVEEGFLQSGQGRNRMVKRREPIHLEKVRIPPAARKTSGNFQSSSFGEHLQNFGYSARDIVLMNPTRVRCEDLKGQRRLFGLKIAKDLCISETETVSWLLRLRLANDEPVALQWVVVPVNLVPEIPFEYLVPGGLTKLYEQNGIRRTYAKAEYSPTRATREDGSPLAVETGSPLIEEHRISYSIRAGRKKNVPYEYLTSLYNNRVGLTFSWIDSALNDGSIRQQRLVNKGLDLHVS